MDGEAAAPAASIWPRAMKPSEGALPLKSIKEINEIGQDSSKAGVRSATVQFDLQNQK